MSIQFPEITDALRIKTLSQRDGDNHNTYPLGTEGMYIDMLSDLDLQEQMLFGSGLQVTDVDIQYNDNYTTVTEIFSLNTGWKTEDDQIVDVDTVQEIYKKVTTINASSVQTFSFIVSQEENANNLIADDNGTEDPSDDTDLVYNFTTGSGLGEVTVILYRKEGFSWTQIHRKEVSFTVDPLNRIVGIHEWNTPTNYVKPQPGPSGEEDSGVRPYVDSARVDYAIITS